MKILFLCDGMVFEVTKETVSLTSGYSYLVRDLMQEFAAKKNCSVFCYAKNLGMNVSEWRGIHVLKRSFATIIRRANPYYFLTGLKFARKMPNLSFYEFAYLIYAYLEGGLVEKLIRDGSYDLVSIQGVTRLTVPYILACQRMGVKYSVSFHALDYFQSGYSEKGQYAIQWILNNLASKGIPTSFISTGMKERAMRAITPELNTSAEFNVILNGFSRIEPSDVNVRSKYGIPQNAVVGLCCANITRRKNQIQLVRAYNRLPQELKDNLYILLVGEERDADVRAEIQRTGCNDRVIICGAIDHVALAPYYNAANFGIVSSLSEGFGLSIIESFSFGNPVVAWADLDAIRDVFHSEAMVVVEDRSDIALAQGISRVIFTQWDTEKIVKHSEKFSIDSMIKRYEEWFLSQIGV